MSTASDERTATSIGEYLEICSSLDVGRVRVWYRGQSNSAWRLEPGMLRAQTFNGCAPSKRRELENSLRRIFMNRAAQHGVDHLRDVFEELAIMQHYGLPTRLLDWSETALVGLHFAVNGSPGTDGTVWLLWPESLGRRVETGFQPGQETEKLRKKIETKDISRTMCWFPRYVTPRLEAQRGAFTVHRLDGPTDFADEADGKSALVRVRIPSSAKEGMAWQLRVAGVSHMDLFPDLQGGADDMKEGFGAGFDLGTWEHDDSSG